ncbi:(2Fe-2S)-binding protein [Streptacidiphilus albus]|jgi:carbon-monoxide dehydrogenase small subunit|uniref:(2Fe-2S)-binding protein n=1 Tax=Streptacidiphilus albus TaxID=105425 RepID=UPI00054BE418|nr:(2Fe-2S)-binding protein [Streptacidiphilus albus]
MKISMSVNGMPVEADALPQELLVERLRDDLELTGTKIGCDTGQCGTCVVDLDGLSVKSCLVLTVQADGAEVTTIEGVNPLDGSLTELQEGLRKAHGTQCGFCSPGVVMSLRDLLARETDPSEERIREWLTGNLCRCTGYQSIVRGVQSLAAAPGN